MLPAPARIAAPPRPKSRASRNPAVPPPPVAGAAVGTGLADGLGVADGDADRLGGAGGLSPRLGGRRTRVPVLAAEEKSRADPTAIKVTPMDGIDMKWPVHHWNIRLRD